MRTRPISWAVARIGAGALALATLISTAEAQTASGRAPASSKASAAQTKKAASKAEPKKAAEKKASAKAPAKKASAPAAKSKAPAQGKAQAKDAQGEKRVAADKKGGKGASSKAEAKKAPSPSSNKRPQRTASTQPVKSKPSSRKKSKKPEPPCFKPKIQVFRGFHRAEAESLSLTYCDGKPAPNVVESLSLIARPTGTPRPKKLPNKAPPAKATKGRAAKGKTARAKKAQEPQALPGGEWVPGVKLVDEGLVTRLQKVIDHFGAKRVYVISGYRPRSDRSFHQSAKALDFRIDGVKNEALVAFCRTLPDTGCGYYPNSSFVHMDVRPPKTGHIYWIDASGPGESPRYVSSWPPKENPDPGDNVVLDPAITGESDPSEVTAELPSRRKKQGSVVSPPSDSDDELPSLLDAFGADFAKPSEPMQPPADLPDLEELTL